MNFVEHIAKTMVLAPAGIPVPLGRVCRTPEEAGALFSEVGPCHLVNRQPAEPDG